MTVHPEFQAVILAAGEGSRMYPITEEIPKALLPVGNRPLIWYPVRALEKFGFQDIIIVTRQSHRDPILQSLKSCCSKKMNFTISSIADDADISTVESLRQTKEKIKTDLFVLSCDLVCDVSLHCLADAHRTNDASVTAMFSKRVDFAHDSEIGHGKGRKQEKGTDQKDIVSIDPHTGRLLFIENEAETDQEYSVLNIRKSLLKRYPNLLLRNDLLDAHCYIFKPWVLDYLMANKSLENVKSDVIPHLVRKQFSKMKKSTPDAEETTATTQAEQNPELFKFAVEDDVSTSARGWSSNPVAPSSTDNVIRCHAYVRDDGVCLRVNTLPAYAYVNRQATKILPLFCDQSEVVFVHPSATLKEKSQVGHDCLLGEKVAVDEGVSVKRSVIGDHCNIGAKVKITNSVIMDHVTIKESCVISGCVVCRHAYVGEKCLLKDSHVGANHKLADNVELKGELVTRETIGFDS